MIEVLLPDGSTANFPDGTAEEEIVAAIQRAFAEPRPETLEPGEWAYRRNGTAVTLNRLINRYVVYDRAGSPTGYRARLTDALDAADTLPPAAPPRRQKASPPPPAEPV